MMRAGHAGTLQATARGLCDGLGVEGIAVKHGLDPAIVRAAVAHLRKTGRLASVIDIRICRQMADAAGVV